MRAGCSPWWGVVLGVVGVTGCAPFFSGEAGPASPEGPGSVALYRGPAPATVGEGVYGNGAPATESPSPTVEIPSPAAVEAREPVTLLRAPAWCPGPVVVTVACAGGGGGPRVEIYETDAPPPAPYKPWPYEGPRAPPLYHDR